MYTIIWLPLQLLLLCRMISSEISVAFLVRKYLQLYYTGECVCVCVPMAAHVPFSDATDDFYLIVFVEMNTYRYSLSRTSFGI